MTGIDNEDRGGGRGAGLPRQPSDVRIIKSESLFGSAREIIIDHDGDHYRLRSTSKGKLILTK